MELRNLPGTDGTPKPISMFFRSVTRGMTLLRKNGVALAAGDHGSVDMYKDDSGMYRARLHAFRVTQDEICVKTLKEVREWLKLALPKIF